MKLKHYILCVSLLLVLLLAACSGGGEDDADASSTFSTTDTTESTITETTVATTDTTEATTTPDVDPTPPPHTYAAEPIIWDLSNPIAMRESGAELYISNDPNQSYVGSGVYEFVEWQGKRSLALRYDPIPSFSAYRFMPRQTEAMKLTDSHRWVRVTYGTPDAVRTTLVASNNANGATVTLVPDTSQSHGQYVTSNAVFIEDESILKRLTGDARLWWNVQYKSTSSEAQIYISEIAFFATAEDAYAYYGDAPTLDTRPQSLFFGYGSNSAFFASSGDVYGKYTYDAERAAMVLEYCPNSNHSSRGKYLFMPKFSKNNEFDGSKRFVRVLYSAKNPAGVSSVNIEMFSDAVPNQGIIWNGICNTDGFLLSETRELNDILRQRLKSLHVTVLFSAFTQGGEYAIRGIYFFDTREEAEAFTVNEEKTKVTVKGIDLSHYTIILSEDAVEREWVAARTLQDGLRVTSGVIVPIKTDAELAPTPYEFVIGYTNRAASQNYYSGYFNGTLARDGIRVFSQETSIVFAAFYNPGIQELVDIFCEHYLLSSSSYRPSEIDLTDVVYSVTTRLEPINLWQNADNVQDPPIFTDDFNTETVGTNPYWWTEEGDEDDWKTVSVADGVAYASYDGGKTLTYLHVYEKNSTFTAKLIATPKTAGRGVVALQLRYTSPYAFVRGGYDFSAGEWFITYREGEDFTPVRVSVRGQYTSGHTYTICLKTKNGSAVLTVDGNEILTATVRQVTPGRVAVYTEDVHAVIDDVTLKLDSGMSRVMAGVTHTLLPVDSFLEGGTLIKLADGGLHYIHFSGVAYVSYDDGRSWQEDVSWYNSGYPSVIRLQNGDLLRQANEGVGGVVKVVMKISRDEGKTWTTVGIVCNQKHEKYDGMRALNMNDKLTQMSDGRIFYVQSFGVEYSLDTNQGHIKTCGEIYYSDDNGVTWTRSKTSTYTMPGNEDQVYFGEGKIIECEGGVLRFLCSWNAYGNVMYSESTDNGETWGELIALNGFKCSRSSFAIMRDPYAESCAYYMVWVYNNPTTLGEGTMPRSRLAFAYSKNGIDWQYLGDVWCWESEYTRSAQLNHIADPFVYITEDAILVGCGISEKTVVKGGNDHNFHQAQRQHIWRFERDALIPYDTWPDAR